MNGGIGLAWNSWPSTVTTPVSVSTVIFEPFVAAAEEELHACRGRASDDNRRVDPASIT